MDRGPMQDPGEDPPPEGASTQQGSEVTDLKEQFEQQQVLIAQLKEMLRKTDQTNVSQEKVDRYASTLSKMTVRAKRIKLKKETCVDTMEKDIGTAVETPVTEKISLLRRQLEENKVKLAERGKSQRGIEEMVSHLKAQLDDSFQLINDTSSNFSLLETKSNYSKESSSEELYNILITKEKKITDLNLKIQKLESTVLDLQENLKEKDCVIDARTKAITLMTESLSKKSKNTQDTLDDTKEQMRKMQENFVKLENEMKARQMKLLDDLRLKNLEIADLQEVNETLRNQNVETSSSTSVNNEEIDILKREIENLMTKLRNIEDSNNSLMRKYDDLEKINTNMKNDYENELKQLQDSLELSKVEGDANEKKIKELQNIIEKLKSDLLAQSVQNKEILLEENNVLKKNLDDLNKNLIKSKAEHKKKIKVLNKKIDTFKKIGDLNDHIVKLSEENDSLKEKIAELEEEKGNFQLKMIEFSKDSYSEESSEEQCKTNKLTILFEEQMKKFEDLISENSTLKEQLELSKEKLQKLADLQNETVSSEITSIQFEQFSEKLQEEKNSILSEKISLLHENEELLLKIEILNKEKLELQSKLDQYIQENMDLIDKLEKLSAEKVSSAESIEIVENLTHQEKLELEEYQKNLDPHSGKLKISEEHLESTPDLNDSVNQLTEDTSELLQKIELFTVERREVMEKMESLTNENSQLNIKLKQIENNRDLLTETYEQLQSEKEELDNKIEALNCENKKLKDNIESMKSDYRVEEFQNLTKNLYDLEREYIKLREENEDLQKQLKIKSEIIQEKDSLESELSYACIKIENLERKLNENLEEINTYQSVIAENKEEFIQSATHLNKLKEIINFKDNEIEDNKNQIEHMNSKLEILNETITNLENQNRNNEENIHKIESLEKQMDDLKLNVNDNLDRIGDSEKELEESTNIIKELNVQLKKLSNKNLELQNALDIRNEEENKIISLLKQEMYELNQQIKTKDEMFHKASTEMKEKFILLQKQTDTTAESLDNMKEPLQKKIADLSTKNSALVEKMKKIAANLKKKTQTCQDLEKQLLSNQEKWETELNEKNMYIKEREETIEAIKREADMYKTETKQLQQMLNEKVQKDNSQSQAIEVRSEISLQEELSGSSIVSEQISKSSYDTSYSKIQELELIIETQESDIINFKERINTLEQTLAEMDERRETLEQKTNELGVQLQEKSLSFEEISKTEDILEEKLKNLREHNETVEKKLEDTSREKESLLTENVKLKSTKEKLKHKLAAAQDRVNELIEAQKTSLLLEEEIQRSKNQIGHLENELRKLETEKIQLEECTRLELEKLDNDWQLQFEIISREKSELNVMCEKSEEKIVELTELEGVLSGKVKELEAKLEKSYELNETSDRELMSQQNQLKKMQELLTEKREELDHYAKELSNFESLRLKELDMTTEMNDLRTQNLDLKIKLDNAVQELKSLTDTLQQVQIELNRLKITKEELQNKLQSRNDEEHEAPKLSQPLFSWPDDKEDPFSFASAESVQKQGTFEQGQATLEVPKTETYNEESSLTELLQKVKTLEFMLKNVENERDELLNQCSHLSNELMRLVYEKKTHQTAERELITYDDREPQKLEPVNETLCVKKTTYLCYPDESEKDENVPTLLESQILPEDFIENSKESDKQLQDIEFTKSKDIVDNTVVPFEEEECLKRETYLCYPQNQLISEAQIQSSSVQDTNECKQKLEDLKPVHEPLFQKKETYQCHPDQLNVDSFGEDDDGWGWNAEEARIEEQRNREFESNAMRIKIVELENKIKTMEADYLSKNQEYQELQIKSGKLIKKLKELKNKNEKLLQERKQEDDDTFNLESAIQDELKNQVQSLERKLTEIGNELAKEKNDKQNLQKKIETLSSTNQRLSELREKQDIELLMWKRKTEELKSKLDQFEWGDHGGSPEKTAKPNEDICKITQENETELQETIATLNETIKELTLDNEELQTLLEEQRELRISAEKSKSVKSVIDNMKTEKEYMDIVNEKHSLEIELNNIESEKKRLQNELNEIIKRNNKQLEEFNSLFDEKVQLEKVLTENDEIIKKLSFNIEQLRNENVKLQKLNSDFEEQVQELHNKIIVSEETQVSKSSIEITSLVNNNEALSKEIQDKISNIESLIEEKEKLCRELNEKDAEIKGMRNSLEEKTSSFKLELENQFKTTEKLREENEKLIIQKNISQEQLQNVLLQIEEKNDEFKIQIQQLNQEWQILVDQRGSDVAESWKLHLDSRETEFDQIQQQLRKELNDLEERCNSLVNENNELRKNVDTEIRNEVDRVSAMQQQINDYQQYIRELSQSINENKTQLINAEKEINQLQIQINEKQKIIEANDVKIGELQIVIEALQKQFDDKRIIVENVVQKLEHHSLSPVLFSLESILEELSKQLNSSISPEELSQINKNMSDKDSLITHLQNEIASKLEQIEAYQQSVESNKIKIRELEQQIESSTAEQVLTELNSKLVEQEATILSLQNQVKANLEDLQISRQKVTDLESLANENNGKIKELSEALLQKDQVISDLTYQLQHSESLNANENENVHNLQCSLQHYQMQYEELQSNFNEKSSLVDAMSDELEKQYRIHLERETEVKNLKMYVEELERSHVSEKEQLEKEKVDIIETQNQEIGILRNQLSQSQVYTDELKADKETSQASVNYLQAELQAQYRNIEELNSQIESCRSANDQLTQTLNEELQKKTDKQEIVANVEDKQVAELKEIIEDQVLKIEDLKQKLFEKSKDYDSLIAEMDVGKSDLKMSHQDMSSRPPMGQGQLIGPTTEDDLNEWVSRPELDIALYMLHQRDVRCEELTVELTQLLEERDTLQLRLSNALREKEEYKRISAMSGNVLDIPSPPNQGSPSKGAIPKGRVSEIVLKSSGTELATEAEEIPAGSESELETKLTELKNIGYKRDKTLLDEQQKRRLQQLSIMQQHMDEASRLPPEAAARLVDANYTLSRDVQSPSKVLLNWLWGRSTPKVNEL